MNQNIETLISFLESRACDCEWLVGWRCDVHKTVDDLRQLIEQAVKPEKPSNG